MGNSSHLFESLFRTSLSSDDLPAYLAQVAEEHPYFSPVQFFLLQQIQTETPAYKLQAAKTVILFNNAYWLNFQLLENEDIISRPNETFTTSDEVENFFNEGVDEDSSLEKFDRSDDTAVGKAGVDESIDSPSLLSESPAHVKIEENSIPGLMADTIPDRAEEYVPTSTEDKHEGDGVKDIEHHGQEIEGSLAEVADINQAVEEHLDEAADIVHKEKNEVSLEPAEDIKAINTIDTVPKDSRENVVVADPEVMPDEELPLTEDDLDPANTKPLNFKLNLETSNNTEKEITFEPLHTTDYFASLGIKLSGDVKANDKLGKQLKSFTEWLKTMKKIHTDKLEQSSGQADQVIQNLAEKSNTEDEVLTETMAEVLLQQGKADKAIDVYKKLSLLNPSKNAYFAAKIDQLKQ